MTIIFGTSPPTLDKQTILSIVGNNPDTNIEGDVPAQCGIHSGDSDLSISELKKLPALKKVEIAHSISELSKEFVFFNHTMLFSKGGLDFDIIKEYQAWKGRDDIVNYILFNRPLFTNLNFSDGTGNHDNMLCFTSVEHWAEIESSIREFTIINRPKDYLFTCTMTKVATPDPKNPFLTINPYVWELNGSSASWGYTGWPVPRLLKKPYDTKALNLLNVMKEIA